MGSKGQNIFLHVIYEKLSSGSKGQKYLAFFSILFMKNYPPDQKVKNILHLLACFEKLSSGNRCLFSFHVLGNL